MNTSAQIAAVAALDLPFDLSSAEINRQFTAEGAPIPQGKDRAHARATELAENAMNNIVDMPSAEEIARFRAERQAAAAKIRAGWQQEHQDRNARAAAEAAARKQARLDAHLTRNAEIKAAALARRAAMLQAA